MESKNLYPLSLLTKKSITYPYLVRRHHLKIIKRIKFSVIDVGMRGI